MARLAVQPEDLHNQSLAVQSGAADVSDILGRLTTQIQELAAAWEGGASQAFQTRWQEWQTGAQNVRQAMEDMGMFLQRAAEAYATTEESLRSSAAGR